MVNAVSHDQNFKNDEWVRFNLPRDKRGQLISPG